jgi:membrane-associated phospholipid phosphatase
VRSLRTRLLVLVGLAAVIRVAAYDVGPLQRADVRAMDATHLYYYGTAHRVAEALVSPFDPLPYALILLVVVGVAAWRGRLWDGLVASWLILAAAATTQILKPLLAAPRPQASGVLLPDNAWPSGHSTAAAALGIALVLLAPPGRRVAVAIVATAGALVVGIALVALGRHYPSDVLGGYCVAGAWGVAAWAAVTRRRALPAA